jgi:hypothetical protein
MLHLLIIIPRATGKEVVCGEQQNLAAGSAVQSTGLNSVAYALSLGGPTGVCDRFQ